MTTAIERHDPAQAIEELLVAGDLSKLSAEQRVHYYRELCNSLGLDPLTQPFEYLTLQGKLTLYPRKGATEQLRRIHKVSTRVISRDSMNGVYIVTAEARTLDGRTDESIGAVSIDGLRGEALANALMKAETKAKRRATLALLGLGMLDETEVSSISDARVTVVDDDGVIQSERRALPSRIDQPPPMTQSTVIESIVNGVNAEKRDMDDLIGYVEQRGLTIGDACRRLGIANTPRGLREAIKGTGLDALKDHITASLNDEQPTLPDMPAVERDTAATAPGLH